MLLLGYEAVTVSLWSGAACPHGEVFTSPAGRCFAVLQNLCRVMPLVILHFCRPTSQWSCRSWSYAGGLLGMGVVVSQFVPPVTLQYLCSAEVSQWQLQTMLVWSAVLLGAYAVYFLARHCGSKRNVPEQRRHLTPGTTLAWLVMLCLFCQVVSKATAAWRETSQANVMVIEALLEHGQGVLLLARVVRLKPVRRLLRGSPPLASSSPAMPVSNLRLWSGQDCEHHEESNCTPLGPKSRENLEVGPGDAPIVRHSSTVFRTLSAML